MSIDLTQYGFIPDPVQGEEIDLTQYGFIPDKKPNVQEETSFLRTLGNLAIGGVSGAIGFAGDIVDLTRKASEYIADEAISLGTGKPSKQVAQEREAQKKDSQRTALGAVASALGSFPPTTQATASFLDTLSGGILQPKTATERGARTVGSFIGPSFLPIGGVARAGETGLARLLGRPSAKELAGQAGAGVGVATSQELDGGLLGDVIGGGLGLAAGRTGANVASFGKTLATGGPKAALAKAISGKGIDKEFLKEAKALGIEVTPGSVLNSRAAQFIETKLAQSGLSGEKLAVRRKEVAESLAQALKRDAEQLSKQSFDNEREALIALQDGVKESRDFVQKPIREAYENARLNVYTGEKVVVPNLAETVTNIRRKLEKTLLKGEATDAAKTRKTLERLESQLYRDVPDQFPIFDANGNQVREKRKVLAPISVEDLLGTKIDLNDIINFEVQGGSQQLLKEVNKAIEKEIETYGKSNPTFWKNYSKAQKDFAQFAKDFRQSKDINRLLTTENPGQLSGIGNNLESLKQLERALVQVPNGKELLNRFKRSKLEDVLVNKVIDADGKVSLLKQKNILKDKKSRAFIKELVGAENFSKIERISKLSGKIEAKLNNFINGSNTFSSAADAYIAMDAFTSALTGVLTLNPLKITYAGAKYFAPELIGNLWADKAFLDEVIKLADAPVRSKTFMQSLGKLSTIVAREAQALQQDEGN